MKTTAKILRRLADMAERLGIPSNQAILIYCGSNNWLDAEHTAVAVGILEKIAEKNKIGLFDEIPFIQQLLEKGVLTAQEGELFGWKKKQDRASEKDEPRRAPRAAKARANGNGTAATAD